MESHLKEVKKIIEYVMHTTNFGLWYLKQKHFNLCSYTYLDFTRLKSDRKSISGACFFLRSCFVSWMYRKQKCYCSLHHLSGVHLDWSWLCPNPLVQHTLRDFGLEKKGSPCYVIVLMQLALPRTWYFTLKQNTLRLIITSLESMLKKET